MIETGGGADYWNDLGGLQVWRTKDTVRGGVERKLVRV